MNEIMIIRLTAFLALGWAYWVYKEVRVRKRYAKIAAMAFMDGFDIGVKAGKLIGKSDNDSEGMIGPKEK